MESDFVGNVFQGLQSVAGAGFQMVAATSTGYRTGRFATRRADSVIASAD
ncbi:MAG: hypothetical protein RIK87_29605 [Fuerstiella sp.]